MALPLLAAVSISTEETGLSSADLSRLGNAYLEITDDIVTDAIHYIFNNFAAYHTVANVTAVTDNAAISEILNAGALKAVVTLEQYAALKGTFADSRLAVKVSNAAEAKELPKAVGLFVDAEVVGEVKEKERCILASFKSVSTDAALEVAKLGATPIIPREQLTVDPEANPELIPVAAIVTANITSDREDGLLTTIVVDEQGVALGLVYSSPESVKESFRTGTGVYQSRKRGLWYKGATSGAVQELVRIDADCDGDCLRFFVRQKGAGFCHLDTATCFGPHRGISKLSATLVDRKANAPAGSYTARLFSDAKLLRAKIMEEAEELCDATTPRDIAFEAADLIYFALTKCVSAGVSLADIEASLDAKSYKVKRRQGDAKGKWAEKEGIAVSKPVEEVKPNTHASAPAVAAKEAPKAEADGRIVMKRFDASTATEKELDDILRRPAQKTNDIMGIVGPIVADVRARGDQALLDFAAKFDKATTLTSPVLKAPYAPELMALDEETIRAIDISFENIRKFHAAQKEDKPTIVETMPGVKCSRFVRPIERVGCYIPGGTAVLPSTALMLGVPALVAGCKKIIFASPPRPDGTCTPEIVYVAHKVGAECIVLAGGAQAVAALAYGTESVPKVDKILGPGNQFVTAGKMLVSNDTSAGVSIDMPAGPSEVLVIADSDANPAFVASDLLSQAEHGVDSQVILVAVDLTEEQLRKIEDQVHEQAMMLPRVDIVKGAIAHSVTLQAKNIQEAVRLSNVYAPEHLILQVRDAAKVVDMVEHAGSIFVGAWTPESVGDYSAGVNHSLPTYGYARQYSGVNLGTYVKHVTSSELSEEGLRNVGEAVMRLAKVEQLEAHRRAVEIRLEYAGRK